MENAVTLKLEKYEELKVFKKALEENGVAHLGIWNDYYLFLDSNEALKEFKAENDKLSERLNELKKPIKDTKTIEDIKQMSLWSLIKWKLKN